MDLFRELKRRNVYKVAVAYAVVAWLLIQIATQTFPFFDVPAWAIRLVILLLVLGFPVALILAWAFELTPEGLKRTEKVPSQRRSGRGWIAVVIAAGLCSAGLFFLGRFSASKQHVESSVPAKSIAVLPFENRSEDKANAYLAEGIQDEILTRLAKIDDLKVISRTSTQRYKSSPENLPEIAKQLGVGHVLEGSVQKVGDKVRVNVQLINAQNDAHLWAEVYDRKLTDIFAVESEVAQKIADSLQAKLSGAEQKELTASLTDNPEAYDAYLRGKAAWDKLSFSPEDAESAIAFLRHATQLDPQFAQAWAYLSVAHSQLYASFDRTPQRLVEAKDAVDKAFAIAPDAGDSWFALALYRYRGLSDYDGALDAFDKAQKRGVQRAKALDYASYVKRRQGKWEDALSLQAEAERLDPRNPNLLSEHAETFRCLRRFADVHRVLDRALEITPRYPNLLAQKAEAFIAEGDLENAGKLLELVPIDARDPSVFGPKIAYLTFAGRSAEAIEAFETALRTPEAIRDVLRESYRTWLGLTRLTNGDADGARADLEKAKSLGEQIQRRGHEGVRLAADMALLYSLLGDKAAVEQEAQRLEARIANDAYEGPGYLTSLAAARAWLGETDAAIEALDRLLKIPGAGALTPSILRLDPVWSPLRNDPRFRKLAEMKP